MRVTRVVIVPPLCRMLACVVKRAKPSRIEQFLADPIVARFAEGVVRRPSGARKVEFHDVPMGPLIQMQRYEFRTVMTMDSLRLSAGGDNASEHVNDLRSFEAIIDLQVDTLATKGINYGQELDLAAISEHIMHEVHCPALVGRRRHGWRFPNGSGSTTTR